MIQPTDTTGQETENHDESRAQLPASTRAYVNGEIHPSVRVPIRAHVPNDELHG